MRVNLGFRGCVRGNSKPARVCESQLGPARVCEGQLIGQRSKLARVCEGQLKASESV